MKFKRLAAYIFDIFIVSLVSSLLFTVLFTSQATEYSEKTAELVKSIRETGSGNEEDEYLKEQNYDIQKSGQTLTIINISFQIVYFIFLQFFLNGQTLGKKLLRLRVTPMEGNKLEAGLFVLRSLILYTIPIKIIDVICLMELNMNKYLKVSNILGNINMIIMIAIIGTIIFREDERGLHDLIAKTKVIYLKKEKNN